MSTQTIFKTAGSTSQSTELFLVQKAAATSPGDPITGLAYNTSSLTAYYKINGTGTATAITLATQTDTGAYSSGGFVETSSTNAPGCYRFDIPNACLATAGEVTIVFNGAANMATHSVKVICTAIDLYDSVRAGLTALPNAAAAAAGGIPILGVNAVVVGPNATFGQFEGGVAQSVTSTTLVGRAAATDDSVKAGMTLFVYGSTQGYWQSVVIDSVSGDTFTIAAWPIATPSGTISYIVQGTPQASSSLPTPANVTKWNGTTVATPATAGIPDVNAKNINNVATTSVTTINANQGTTQPINFTGTGASALAKSDMVDVAGAAVSTSTAQLGVNAVQAGGTAWGSGAITAASIATDAITAAKIAADAIGASELAADAVTEIQSGLLTAASANATRYQKNTASQKVLFTLVDSTDHVTRKTGITVTAQRSLDGAAFGSATGTVTEVGNGVYYLSTSTADINADDVVFRFTGTACDPVELHVVTY